MMCKPAIKVQSLSKSFPLYDQPFRCLLGQLFGVPPKNTFTALHDIKLEVRQGETVGVLGRNGSGKSTLLQIIAGTMQATSGSVEVSGRVAALLELGAGFNPEYTGRENIALNASLLGIGPEQLRLVYDDIIDFAELGSFIDQPLKTYSSGMFVRLGFSVAIYTNPDILIVDEALSVGDEAFQRKCMARIEQLKSAGATILFVSHNVGTILDICDRAALLDAGELLAFGEPKKVVGCYQKLLYAEDSRRADIRRAIREGVSDGELIDGVTADHERHGMEARYHPNYYDPGMISKSLIDYERAGATIREPHVVDESGYRVNRLRRNAKYWYCYDVDFQSDETAVRFGSMIKNRNGVELGGVISHSRKAPLARVPAGAMASVRLPFACRLNPGTYFLNAGVVALRNDEEIYLHRIVDALMIQVEDDSDSAASGLVDFRSDTAPVVTLKSGVNA